MTENEKLNDMEKMCDDIKDIVNQTKERNSRMNNLLEQLEENRYNLMRNYEDIVKSEKTYMFWKGVLTGEAIMACSWLLSSIIRRAITASY